MTLQTHFMHSISVSIGILIRLADRSHAYKIYMEIKIVHRTSMYGFNFQLKECFVPSQRWTKNTFRCELFFCRSLLTLWHVWSLPNCHLFGLLNTFCSSSFFKSSVYLSGHVRVCVGEHDWIIHLLNVQNQISPSSTSSHCYGIIVFLSPH